MREYPAEGSSGDLVALVLESGLKVSKTQLARWHRAGLIPLPVGRRFLGRPRGSVTVYPPGTGRQLLELLRIHSKERRLPFVAWRLWWARYDVSLPKRIRPFLDRVLSAWEKAASSARPTGSAKRLGTARLAETALRKARKRVGSRRFPEFLETVLKVVSGEFEGWSQADESALFEKGLGLRRARIDRVSGLPPWLQGDAAEALGSLSSLLQPDQLRNALNSATDQDLLAARDELRSVLSLFRSVALIAEAVFGRGAFGFAVFRDLDAAKPPSQAFFMLIWLVLRKRPPFADGLELLTQWEPTLTASVPLYEGLLQLAAEVPAFSDLITPRRVRTAMRNPEVMSEFQFDLRERIEQHKEEVQAFRRRHPEFNNAVEVLDKLTSK